MSTKVRQGCSNVKRTLAIRARLANSIRLLSKPKTTSHRSSASNQAIRSNEHRLKLIKQFKQRELLWNEQHRSYGSEMLRTKAWRIMAKDMNLSVDTCKRLVQRIRVSYEFRRRSLTSYQLAKNQPEWFYVAESFLKPIVHPTPPPPPFSPSPPISLEPNIMCRDFNILVKKENVDAYTFAISPPELEIPDVTEVKIETSEVLASKITCRNCLKFHSDNQLDQLVSVDEEWDDRKSLKQVYIELIGPTDLRLPSVVCASCAEMLQRFLEFRNMSKMNAKIYLDTVAGIYGEHNYDRETAKRRPNDQDNEEGDDEHEDTFVFVEPLPNLIEECKIVRVTPRVDIEKLPSTIAESVDVPIEVAEPEKIFVDQSELAAPKKQSGRQKYFCSICGKHVLHKQRHLRTHKENSEFFESPQCPQCPRKDFKTQANYLNHLKWVHKRGQEIKCKFCNLVFSCYTSRTNHQQAVHEKLLFHCDDCEKSFKNVTLLRNHRSVHQPAGPKTITTCDQCGKTFAHRSLMLRHRKFVHVDALKYCAHCDYSVKSRRSLIRHFRTAHPADGKVEKIQCNLCGYIFKSTHYLRNHVAMVHQKMKLYGCHVCNESFVHGKQLRRHLDKWHADSQQLPKGSKFNRVFLGQNDSHADGQIIVEKEIEIGTEIC